MTTERDVKNFRKRLKELEKEFKKNPEKINEYLHATGMYTKKGNLKKQFKV